MKRYRKFELYAREYLPELGFENVDVTRGVRDWGADLFCEKNGLKYVGQVKLYGSSKTRISRKDVMELYGVKAYFDCDKAFFFYNGKQTEEAIKAASKLGIEWIFVDPLSMDNPLDEPQELGISIDQIWNEYIKPLAGKALQYPDGKINSIVSVDDAVIVRETSTGKRSRVKKDLFKWIIDRIQTFGYAAAIDLRNEFHTQASSFVTLVFKEIPLFEVTYNPRTITFAKSSASSHEEEEENSRKSD